MPSSPKSPYATSFKSAIKRGTPAGIAVAAIAKRTGKNTQQVFSSLHRAGLCDRQKFNGQWVYWPAEPVKRSPSQAKHCQIQMWQNLVDWCIASGNCKPEQLTKNAGSQNSFMAYCRKYFNRQLNGGTSLVSKPASRKPKSRRSTPRSRTRTTSSSYKFPRAAGKTTRRYRKAA